MAQGTRKQKEEHNLAILLEMMERQGKRQEELTQELKERLQTQHEELLAVSQQAARQHQVVEGRLQHLEGHSAEVETVQQELRSRVETLEVDLKQTISAQLTSTAEQVATVGGRVAVTGDRLAATEEQMEHLQ